MKRVVNALYRDRSVVVFFLCSIAVASAQQTQSTPTLTAVPRLVRFTGSFHPAAGPSSGTMGATFAVYGEQEGGAPLWTEDQNVELAANGDYAVMLGAASNAGVPLELFATGESRWLQVKFYTPGEIDLPRVLLVSVPYALKAADADTLGGQPASAFVHAPASYSPALSGPVPTRGATRPASAVCTSLTSTAGGSVNTLALFDANCDILSSTVTEAGGNVGIGTTTPAFPLDINGSLNVGNGAWMKFGGGTGSGLGASNSGIDFGFGEQITRAASDGHLQFSSQNGIFQFSGSVGIGTASPAATLEIERAANDSGAILEMGNGVPWWQFSRSAKTGALSLQGAQVGYNNLILAPTGGNVGVGTSTPGSTLTVAGVVQSTTGGFMFPDGSTQTKATMTGPAGPAGPPGPATHSVAVCVQNTSCSCAYRLITSCSAAAGSGGTCSVTSDTGSCTVSASPEFATDPASAAACVCSAQ